VELARQRFSLDALGQRVAAELEWHHDDRVFLIGARRLPGQLYEQVLRPLGDVDRQRGQVVIDRALGARARRSRSCSSVSTNPMRSRNPMVISAPLSGPICLATATSGPALLASYEKEEPLHREIPAKGHIGSSTPVDGLDEEGPGGLAEGQLRAVREPDGELVALRVC
jgi:hypothetical protein